MCCWRRPKQSVGSPPTLLGKSRLACLDGQHRVPADANGFRTEAHCDVLVGYARDRADAVRSATVTEYDAVTHVQVGDRDWWIRCREHVLPLTAASILTNSTPGLAETPCRGSNDGHVSFRSLCDRR